jgi:Zn-dependent M28 family amino/carboxypeptidase
LAVIPGGELANEYVMVGAHYDHLGSSCPSSVVGDTVCNGATDNAAGVAAVLAVGRAIASLPNPPRRSVILVLWDREEDGLLGSQFYVQNPLVPLASTIAYVNFDIQGANLLPSLKNFSAAVSPETGGAVLRGFVDDAVDGEGLGTRKLSYIFGQLRSDYANLVNGGVPSVFFSDSTGGCYHTSQDDVSVVDFDKLHKQAKIGFKVTRSLIDTDTPPPFIAPAAPLATYEDAVVINDVLNDGVADLALFTPADQATLLQFQSDLNAMVADGPGNFDSADVTALLLGTIDVVGILTNIDCDGFL